MFAFIEITARKINDHPSKYHGCLEITDPEGNVIGYTRLLHVQDTYVKPGMR